ncbi:MRG-domain-containing protein [Gigaspora margarita]|uniref:Chromatin modification-related protein EAF3 n=1 Tax=Gigaspora margarita TaxID=4874 RepID=A0A8H4A264_GIGMA|nr:MRG-domain-containing protein [Gigaspora margarita]
MAKNKKSILAISSVADSSLDVFQYQRGENVLCYHGPITYPAQILDLRIVYENEGGDVGPQYRIHYKGWNKKWDEWVSESRILKMTEENIAATTKIKQLQTIPPTNSSSVFVQIESMDESLLPTNTQNEQNSKASNFKNRFLKRTIDQGQAINGTSAKNTKRAKKCKISVDITDEGMLRLVDEWQWNTKNQLLIHPMPRPKTVNDILEEFFDFKMEQLKEQSKTSIGRNRGRITKSQELAARDVTNGIKQYFNEALPIYLLYRFERQQYVEMTEKYPRKEMSSIYGAEHLMRLVVKIPDLVHAVQMKEQKAESLEQIFNELAGFLENNCKEYFAKQFEFASAPYIRVIWEY